MSLILKIGCRVRHQFDDGWGQAGCVISRAGDKVHVYWPDENITTSHDPASLIPDEFACQPPEVAA